MSINIIDKYEPQEFSLIATNGGVVVCEKQRGAFLVLRSPDDLKNLLKCLEEVMTIEKYTFKQVGA